jgi:ABC-2 type transport system permease protein
MGRIAAQTRIELLLTVRRAESLLVTVMIPIGVLVFFSLVHVLPTGTGRAVDFLVPGVLALSVISTGMVSVGIATGFERQNGVLRRLGATPLGRSGLLAAKSSAVAGMVLFQSLFIVVVGRSLGWRPDGSALAAMAVMAMGTVAFTAIGLLLAGRLRGETNIAAANGLFLLMLLLGGVAFPVTSLPRPLLAAAHALPVLPFTRALRTAFEGSTDPGSVAALAVWAVAASAAAALWFRWE